MLTKVLLAALAAVGAAASPHRVRSPRAHLDERGLHTFQKRFTGTATFYSVGVDLGHCGEMHYDNEFVVALNTAQFRNQGYPGPDCFRQVTITNTETGITQSASIVDSCPTCSYGDLDLSPTLFEALGAPHSQGVFQISWSFGGGGGGGEEPKPTTKEEPKPTSTWTPEPETSTWTPPPEPSTSTWTPPPKPSTSTWSPPPPEPSSSSESPSPPPPAPSSSSSSSVSSSSSAASSSNSPSPSSSASPSAAPSSSSSSAASSSSSSSSSSSASALVSGLAALNNGTMPGDVAGNLTSSSSSSSGSSSSVSSSSTLSNSTVASAAATASAHAVITNPDAEAEDGNLAGVAAVVAQLGQIIIAAAGK